MKMLDGVNRYETKEEKIAYLEGMLDGVWRFAWWQDGKQYVGTCGTQYADVKNEIKLAIDRLK